MEKYSSKMLSMFGLGGSLFGIKLIELAKEHENILVLSSDVSTPAGLDKYKSLFPDRFMNMGIAEQNMIGTAAGLTDEGYKTISVAQACFISMRCFEQVRQYVGYMKSPQILIGFGSGLSLSFMGNTHYALEDIALMRTVPGMTIVAPCDSLQAMKVLEASLNHDGPIYIRLFGGTGTPIVFNDDFEYHIGKAISLIEGSTIQIIATGSMVSNSIKVANILNEEGISTAVIDMHTIKPLDVDSIDLKCRVVVTIEEHHIIGGLGSAVAEYISSNSCDTKPRLLRIGVDDKFSKVGDYNYLLETNGLSNESILNKIKTFYYGS